MYDGIYDPQWMEDTSMTSSSTPNNQDDELDAALILFLDTARIHIAQGGNYLKAFDDAKAAILAWHNQQLDQAMPEKLK